MVRPIKEPTRPLRRSVREKSNEEQQTTIVMMDDDDSDDENYDQSEPDEPSDTEQGNFPMGVTYK